jgi:hypothetical protein
VVLPNPLSKLPLMVLPFPSPFIGFVGGVAEKKAVRNIIMKDPALFKFFK